MFSINGFALHNPAQGRWVVQPTEIVAASTSWGGVQTEVPGVHGARLSSWSRDMNELKVVVLATKAQADIVEAAFSRNDGELQMAGGWTASFKPTSVGREVAQFTAGQQVELMRVTATLTFPEASWRGPEQTATLGGGGTSSIGVGSTAPVTDALVRFTNPQAGAYISDAVSGTRVQLATGYSGFVVINTHLQRAWLHAEDNWNQSGTEVSTSLRFGTPPYALDLRAVPFGSSTAYRPSVSNLLSAAEIRFRPRVSI